MKVIVKDIGGIMITISCKTYLERCHMGLAWFGQATQLNMTLSNSRASGQSTRIAGTSFSVMNWALESPVSSSISQRCS